VSGLPVVGESRLKTGRGTVNLRRFDNDSVYSNVKGQVIDYFFYRATHVHSADYAVARCLCLSVCHTPVLCINGYTYPQSFSPWIAPCTILVFPYQTGWKYSDGDLPNGGSQCKGGMKKITIFDQYLALSRNWCKIEP